MSLKRERATVSASAVLPSGASASRTFSTNSRKSSKTRLNGPEARLAHAARSDEGDARSRDSGVGFRERGSVAAQSCTFCMNCEVSELDLKSFRKSMLERYQFPGTHAAAVFVAEGQQPSHEVQEVLSRSAQQRWYPVAGGHRVKVPWHLSEGCEHLFEREEWGWGQRAL